MKVDVYIELTSGPTEEFLGAELVSVMNCGAVCVTMPDMSQFYYAHGIWRTVSSAFGENK